MAWCSVEGSTGAGDENATRITGLRTEIGTQDLPYTLLCFVTICTVKLYINADLSQKYKE